MGQEKLRNHFARFMNTFVPPTRPKVRNFSHYHILPIGMHPMSANILKQQLGEAIGSEDRF